MAAFLRVMIAALLAGSLAAQPTPSLPQGGTISGVVVSATGAPLGKATLTLSRNSPPSDTDPFHSIVVTNDSNGRFVFQNVPPGTYGLNVRRAGYLQQQYGARKARWAENRLQVTPGSRISDLSVTMTPQAIISGTVTDEDGDLLDVQSLNLQVRVSQSFRDERGKRYLGWTGGGNINPDGSFVVGNLAPGRYYLSVGLQVSNNNPGALVQGQRSREQFATTYYPNSLDFVSATPIEVAAGAEIREIRIRMRTATTYQVRGTLTAFPDTPERRKNCFPQVQLIKNSLDRTGEFINGQANCRDGSFTFRSVPPGTYSVFASYQPGPSQETQVFASAALTVGNEDVENLTLPLGPLPELPGSLKISGGDPIPESLAVLLSSPNPPGRGSYAEVAADGTFRAKLYSQGRFSVSFNQMPPGSYVKSIRLAGQDIEADQVELTSGASSGPLDILFSPGSAELNGMVRDHDGKPIAGATVVAWNPKKQAIQLYPVQSTNADSLGGFSLKNLAPGKYYIAAWEELESGLAKNRDLLARFESQAANVELEPAGSVSVSVPVISPEATEAEIAKLP